MAWVFFLRSSDTEERPVSGTIKCQQTKVPTWVLKGLHVCGSWWVSGRLLGDGTEFLLSSF